MVLNIVVILKLIFCVEKWKRITYEQKNKNKNHNNHEN